MKLQTFSLVISLFTMGWLGLSETAQAANFGESDQINIFLPTMGFNAAGLFDYENLPSGEISGGSDGLADMLFGKFNLSDTLTQSNRVMDNPDTESDYKPGDLGEFKIDSGLGGFAPYSGLIGAIRAFDGYKFEELHEVNGGFNPPIDETSNNFPDEPFFPYNYFLNLNDQVFFYLTEVEPVNPSDVLNEGNLTIDAKGWMVAVGDDINFDYYKVAYTFSAEGLKDDGQSGGDAVAGDSVTGMIEASATSLVVSLSPTCEPACKVPEPSTVLGLSVIMAGFGLLKKRSSGVPHLDPSASSGHRYAR